LTITQKTGYLLINLGTPKSPSPKDVRAYLNDFLMDSHVIDTPWLLRRLLVSAFILPFRPKQSALAYASIWSEQGSPLLVYSEKLRHGLAQALDAPVALGMRYGEPSIEQAIADLTDQGVNEVTVVPLYPQFADSTVTTSIQKVKALLPPHTQAKFVDAFYADEGYQHALALSVRQALPENFDHLLLSYHGLPERQLTKADPSGTHCLQQENCCEVPSVAHATCYRHQVFATSQALINALGLRPEQYSISFQSRLGRLPWLQPYTDQVLAELPGRGVKNLAVACPAFVADNLETLEEMGIRGRQTFLAAGGESFHLIPCLNDDPAWLKALATLIHAPISSPPPGQTEPANADTSL
jgi:ferrochelatase